MKLPENSLFGILMRARWWVSALATLGVFAVARLVLPEGFAFFAALPFGVIACVVAWKEIRRPRGASLQKALDALRVMPWEEFADVAQRGYRREGYEVRRVAGAADFEMEKSGKVRLVSARRWKAAVTGIEPLKELAAEGKKRGASECLCIVAGELTVQARAYSVERQIRVVEGEELVRLVRETG